SFEVLARCAAGRPAQWLASWKYAYNDSMPAYFDETRALWLWGVLVGQAPLVAGFSPDRDLDPPGRPGI
ncbi:MAG TPA: hypothetical protein VGX76_22215, partial [Pirellulales bacterium]|nr:hypothetical protein [Pirellulales bacterium]